MVWKSKQNASDAILLLEVNLTQMLSQYYADCEEVATLRQKQVCQGLLHLNVFAQSCSQARAQDERHQGRAAKQAEQQKTDMLNSKKYVSIATINSSSVTHLMVTSTYLISTAVTNQMKDKFYTVDMPGVQNVSCSHSCILSPK